MPNQKNSVRTTKPVAKVASNALKSKATSPTTKKLAGSALSNRKKTSKK